MGKRVLYDLDDDIWEVAKDNPSVLVSNALKDQYEGMMKEADAIITPSSVLAKKFKKYFKNKPVFICPNGITEDYLERPHENQDTLKIGYMGAASHWKDLQLIGEVISKLQEKYGIYIYNIWHYCRTTGSGFLHLPKTSIWKLQLLKRMPTTKRLSILLNNFNEHGCGTSHSCRQNSTPTTLSKCDLDIGIAPLEDTAFNHGKSCVKFYEYASVGTVTLASNVLPYSDEVNYLAKNNFKDWYNKLEKTHYG